MGQVDYSPNNNFDGIFSIYNSTVEPLHNGHLGSRQKVKIVERFKQDSMYGLSTKKSGCCREVAVSGGWTVLLKKHTTYFLRKKIYSHSCTVRPAFFTVCLQILLTRFIRIWQLCLIPWP